MAEFQGDHTEIEWRGLWNIALSLSYLYLTLCVQRNKRLPEKKMFHFTADDLKWGAGLLHGKRIIVSIRVEDCNSNSAKKRQKSAEDNEKAGVEA